MFMHKYRPVDSEQRDREQEEIYKLDDECSAHGFRPHKSFYKRCISVQYILILLLLLTNLATLAFWRNASTSEKWAKTPATTLEQDISRNDIPSVKALGPADIPVEMEMRKFSTGITEDRRTEFFGEPDEKTNAAWDSLMDVRLIHLNEQQAKYLGAPTARQYNSSPGSYVGVLEVFHQLHCLNRIRLAFYTDLKGEYGENADIIRRHTYHCFDYLRQSFMCLADVNIGPVGWNATTETYIAEGDGVRECRNFDIIHEWAKKHDVPHAPGNIDPSPEQIHRHDETHLYKYAIFQSPQEGLELTNPESLIVIDRKKPRLLSGFTVFFMVGMHFVEVWDTHDLKEKAPMLHQAGPEELIPKRRNSCLSRCALAWLPHVFLVAIYTAVLLTWPMFRPKFKSYSPEVVVERTNTPWTARFDGTFLELGDFFNISETKEPSVGAVAAWNTVQQYKIHDIPLEEANFVRVSTAHVKSADPGDPRVLSKLHRLHCLHVLWRRWHNQMTAEESNTTIVTEPHDNHCFAILRYGLMCEGDIQLKQVGWPATDDMHAGYVDVDRYCSDPEKNGIEREITGS
ncbi:uncharacterized protein KD926_002047 [Aspergillus affinis]|uniref:uncharacterized protein n=1 Tax=Aspergillus affinis TaxID=1070780 RepID=UPI0022FE3EF6|nr:uncharacterized protein KD926_002047 [Aspergillus affinis]KAI9036335.1 hypothetical protein KD926_002047 [Aspergillus affinis]